MEVAGPGTVVAAKAAACANWSKVAIVEVDKVQAKQAEVGDVVQLHARPRIHNPINLQVHNVCLHGVPEDDLEDRQYVGNQASLPLRKQGRTFAFHSSTSQPL